MATHRARTLSVATLIACFLAVVATTTSRADDQNEQLKVLSKQVKALLDRREEDVRSIEDNLRKKLFASPEIENVLEEMKNLRLEVQQLRQGNPHKFPHHSGHLTQEKNEHLTMKWLSNAVAEMKTEVAEIQHTLNSTAILQNREEVYGELTLLRTDASNLNKELEIARTKNVKYEAELMEIREEVGSLRDHCRATAVTCGKMKNQLKAAQVEWSYNLKKINDAGSIQPDDNQNHASRHHRLLRKHIIDLEKTAKTLKKADEDFKTKIAKLKDDIQTLKENGGNDRISGNDINDYIKLNEIKNENPPWQKRLAKLESTQSSNSDSIFNLTRQLSNFDKLHMSMLELLENVESIENKVDSSFPEFRKEISKLEFQMSGANSEIALLKEDQTNTRDSVKALGVSASNLQTKTDSSEDEIDQISEDLEKLKKSASVQNLKLHDHILKSESSTIDTNATRSTIHLVQELKSFEKEYKSIVNKLPHDCGAVLGPNGIYLISPGEGEPIMASCQEGWTLIQKRYDGSANFNRNWNEYSNGFGSATGEHWLGNRNIHYLTRSNCTRLQINMKDIYGKYWQATYDDFRVADYSAGFKVEVNNYSGNASDAFAYQNRMEFSTIDNDRDISNTHCASNYEGGWWFSHCQHANLNGRYNLGLTWFDSSRNEWIAVATSEMRIKKRDNC